MSTDPNRRQVPIASRKTGAVRLSDPVPVHSPNMASGEATGAGTTQEPESASTSTPAQPPVAPAVPPVAHPTVSSAPAGKHPASIGSEVHTATQAGPGDTAPGEKAERTPKTAKPKPEIETLEQFIEYAYGRRGQRASLPFKVQQAISQQPRLDEAAIGRLLVLINADTLLAVPRQILLASREVEGLPALRGALISFVSMTMLRHPAFAAEGVQAAVANRPEALTPLGALKAVAGYTPPSEDDQALKPADAKELRRNATYLLATWLAVHRGLGLEELATLLLQALWDPAGAALGDDNARLRSLTEVQDVAALGVIAKRYRQQAAEARNAQEQASRDVAGLRERIAELTDQRDQLQSELSLRIAEVERLQVSSARELAALREAHSAGSMHQRHELESLRGRMVRRLEDTIETLDVGLSALRNKTPRVEVMIERAEHVLDNLRSELNDLNGED